ncbi:MAG: DNA internalization-related competence protein ComEC/Rec2 [Oscillospiraceae bacterium]|nr:DNA internalization-related competence protein ComEC/Rec2 [Oscillospiraceae bacterium]MCL2278009.1 DNA internalization-related competence protein ComEC/Rec2 [Oscillospiraceae bacterium]
MRKLAVFSFFFALALFLSHYFLPSDWLLIAGGTAALLSLLGLIFRGNNRQRVIISLLAVSIGFLWSYAYTVIFAQPHFELHEESIEITAVITDYPVARTTRGYRVDAQILREDARNANVRLFYFTEAALQPGDIIFANARLRRTDITADGERFDALSSRGIFLSGYISGDIVLKDYSDSLRYVPRRIAHSIAEQIGEIFPDDVAHFMQALLMGRRDDLYRDTALSASLSASGIIHVVSISGMHIAFLMGFLAIVLRNERLFAFYGIPVLLLFMAMTGFTPAVTRAGIMQMFLIFAPLVRRERDSITSLLAALFFILASNPYSVASVGLHLSFSATLGIILFSTKINNTVTDAFRGKKVFRLKLTRGIINYIVGGLSTTFGALIFTLPLTALHFGYVSLIAPLTNLLTIGVVSIIFPVGLLVTLLSFLHPALGTILSFPVTYAARYIIRTAQMLAGVPYSVVYSSNIHIMLWLLYVYIMFTLLPLMKARLREYIKPACIAVMLLSVIILIFTFFPGMPGDSFSVVDVGQGLSVVVESGGHTMVVDSGSLSRNNAGEITHEFLMNMGKTTIDMLVLTHLHADHVNGVEFLFSRMAIFALALADPSGSDFAHVAYEIITLANSHGTDIIYVTETLTFTLGELDVFIYPPMFEGRGENERSLSILTVGSITSLITGDMNMASERALLRFAVLPKLDVLVVGHHGSRHSTSEELLAALSPDIAVIPVGRNSFGHPTSEVLLRLSQFGVTTFRTDLNGHVTIRR